MNAMHRLVRRVTESLPVARGSVGIRICCYGRSIRVKLTWHADKQYYSVRGRCEWLGSTSVALSGRWRYGADIGVPMYSEGLKVVFGVL